MLQKPIEMKHFSLMSNFLQNNKDNNKNDNEIDNMIYLNKVKTTEMMTHIENLSEYNSTRYLEENTNNEQGPQIQLFKGLCSSYLDCYNCTISLCNWNGRFCEYNYDAKAVVI